MSNKDWLSAAELDELATAVLESSGNNVPDVLARLSDNKLNQLYYHLNYRKGNLALRFEQVKDARLDRRNDFEAMAKHATKRFTDLDIEILQMLDYEMAYYTRGILSQVNEETERYSMADVKKSIKRLKRRGLVELMRGLMDESDGMLAGSGWSLCYRNHKHIDKILAVFEGDQNQESLGI